MPAKKEWQEALVSRHGAELQKKFFSSAIAVCGLGGLGSNIAVSLARAGIGKLILIDFDRVDITNIHRQQYSINQIGSYKTEALEENLLKIAPYIEIRSVTKKITEDNCAELLKDADIVIEAFDDAESKAMIVDRVLKLFPKCYIISSSGMAGIDTPNTIKTRKVTNRFYLCGDEVSDAENSVGLVAPRVMLCAAHQALTALRILAEKYDV